MTVYLRVHSQNDNENIQMKRYFGRKKDRQRFRHKSNILSNLSIRMNLDRQTEICVKRKRLEKDLESFEHSLLCFHVLTFLDCLHD